MKWLLVSLLAVGLIVPTAFAKDIDLGNADSGRSGVSLADDAVTSDDLPALRFEARVTQLTATEVSTPEGTFTQLSIPGQQHSETIGAPALPVMNTLVEIPLGADLKVSGRRFDIKRYNLKKDLQLTSPLMPRQPPHPKDGTAVPFAYEPSSYLTEGFLQEKLVTVEDLGVLRDRRLALVKVAPVAYDAVNGVLEVATRIRLTVTLKGADMKATEEMKRVYGSPYFDTAAGTVQTPASLKALNKDDVASPVCYLIVTDRQFADTLQPFVDWKTSKGFQVVTAFTDEVGATPEEIQNYVHGLYGNPEPTRAAPTFLLIVGDKEQVPAFKGGTGRHISDLKYVCATAGDNLPDMLTGRFSAQTPAELVPQIAKTMEYEKYEMADPSFLKNLVLVAGWDSSHAAEWGWPQINYGTQYYFNEGHGFSNINVFLSAGSHQNEAAIRSLVSSGCAFLNYTAHGSTTSWADPGFTKSHIDALQNTGKYPLVVGNCCLTNSFQVGSCFGEAWLRAENKGAIGYIGGSNNTYWDEDLWWGNGFYSIQHPNAAGTPPNREDTGPGAYDMVFNGSHPTNAGMVLAGNLAVQASNTSRKLYYWEVYHLMGDPSLSVFWGLPGRATVEHGGSLALQSSSAFQVQAPAGSLIGVSQDGKLLGAGFASSFGTAQMALTGLAEGTAQVVVTKANQKPYIGSLTVSAE